ncbi:MAG: membrane protein insertase YidC [Lachnospiraceae bacterium]|nr:membrane protein insertase YidC [Lachnospiraceae bacterium]
MPLVLVMETIFSVTYRMFGNAGIAIVSVSIAVNVLSLPLYRKADAIQDEERRMQKLMALPIKHIRKTFKGDERFMILQAYYREQNYSPLYVFRGSLPLLLQIPFFTAAYKYLSNLSLLKGTSFWIINDMGSPDQLLVLFGISINIFPILMTLINFISGVIYTRGFPLKDKAQLYILALIFLVFLYDRPAGLVFYWTLNNLFSLVKNIFLKLVPNPGKVLSVILSAASVVIFASCMAVGKLGSLKRAVFMLLLFGLMNIPTLIRFAAACKDKAPNGVIAGALKKFREILSGIINTDVKTGKIFLLSGLCLTCVYGVLIPMSVVSASPEDFVNVYSYVNPLYYVLSTASIAAGFFLVWGGAIIYFFGTEKVKKFQTFVMFLLAIASLVNYMFFGKNFGTLSTLLEYKEAVHYSTSEKLINVAVLVVLFCVLAFVYRARRQFVAMALSVILIGGVALTAYNVVGVNKDISDIEYIDEGRKNAKSSDDEVEPIIKLSRNEKNVVVILLDRAISGYVPYMLNERPELKEQFSGFTYYPNTISFGEHTNLAAPAVYGGYEYTPAAINARTDETMAEKNDQADLLMPVLFSDNGYQATVCDPSYAGYKDIPDLSIYEKYSGISAYHTKLGEYTNLLSDDELAADHKEIKYRNFFWYSLFKASPLFLQNFIYDSGDYFGTTVNNMDQDFLRNYAVLKNLSKLTDITDNGKGSFFMIHNNTTHNPSELQMPDYVPSGNVNNSQYDDPSRFTLNGKTVDAYKEEKPGKYHYHVNMASFIQLGNWFDYLKEQGIYDNTRIIIVADHGYDLGQFEDMIVNDELDVEAVNPLLMFKDFDAKEFTTDNTFMTNADVPTLAMEGVISDPVNPFTGNEVNSDAKNKEPMMVTLSDNLHLEKNSGNVFNTGDSSWYTVSENIFDKSNWVYAGNKSAGE